MSANWSRPMATFTLLIGPAAPLLRDNVDTEQHCPGLGAYPNPSGTLEQH